VACEFPWQCGNLANCYTLVTYLLTETLTQVCSMFTWVDVCSTQPLCCGIQSAFRRVTHQRPAVVVVFTLDHFVTTQRTMGGPNRYSTACGLPHPASGRRTSAYLTQPLPAVSRAHPARDVDRLSSDVRRGEGRGGDSPAFVRGPMAGVLPGCTPPNPPRPFWARHCPLC